MPATQGDSDFPAHSSSGNNSCTKGIDSVEAFTKWREVDINDDDYIHGDADAPAKIGNNEKNSDDDDYEDTSAAFFRMFGEDNDEDVYEEVKYEYNETRTVTPIPTTPTSSSSSNPTTVMIRHHGAYPNSTGLAVWRGSEILARFLCDQHQQQQQQQSESTSDSYSDDGNNNNNSNNTNRRRVVVDVHQKKVVELGAGAGLPGIVAHRVLGANTVLVTDGDYDALNNLQRNVDANTVNKNTNQELQQQQQQQQQNNTNSTSANTSTTNTTNTTSTNSISCQQLVWGRAIGSFLETHGKQDVVLAADCVYMVPSLKPLWKTIDALLTKDGLFVYVQTAASAVPWKDFSEMVEKHGFEACFEVVGDDLSKYDVDNVDSDEDEDKDKDNCRGNQHDGAKYEKGIHVFRRRR